MKFRFFITLYWPAFIGYLALFCFSQDPFGLGLLSYYYDEFFFGITLIFLYQIFLIWYKKGSWGVHNIPILLAWFFLINYFVIFTNFFWGKGSENIFYTRLLINFFVSIPLLLFQLVDWIFIYIDWPVSRLIRGAGRFCKCQFKKVVLKLDTEGGRRIGLMTMKVMVILLIFFGLFQIIGKIEDKKILEKSDIYQLPIEIESVNLLSFGAHINYRIEGGVSLGIDEELGDKVYITFRGVKTNVIEIDKAYLRPPTNNRYLKMDVIGFISGPHKVSVDVGMGTARYFVDQETSKKIDPKIVSDQKIGTQNYALVRIYKGKMKIEKIRIGDVEL